MAENRDKLRTWRGDRTQAETATALGVSQAAWAAWEVGSKEPDLTNAFGLEKLTGGKVPANGWKRRQRHRTPVVPRRATRARGRTGTDG